MSWRGRNQRDFEEEIRSHLALEVDRLVAAGRSRRDAEIEARRIFGNVGTAQQRFHDASPRAWLDDLGTDVRHAFRRMRLNAAFSANVIGIAALGILASTTTFSIVSGILIQPLPFPHAERVGSIQLSTPEQSTAAVPIDAYRMIEAGTPLFEAIAAYRPGNTVLTLDDEPEQVRYERVTSSFARVYGISPVLGRFFSVAEGAQRAPVALLGYDAWQRRFHGDSSIVGRAISLDGAPVTVIGVMPPGFRATRTEEPVLWLPDVAGTGDDGSPSATSNAVVRLRPDVSVEVASRWLAQAITARVESFATRDSVLAHGRFVPVSALIIGDVERPLRVVLGAITVVLLLVATNLGTLFLVRASARSGETALRRTLGASWWRLLRQSLTESTVLTGVGGAIGVLGAWWTVSALRTLGAGTLPRMQDVTLDWRAVLFAVGSVVVTGVIAGLPSMAATGGSRSVTPLRRLSNTLVAAQVTLSVVLLVGAGLLVKGFLRVLPTSPGFTVSHRAVLSMRMSGRAGFDDTLPGNVQRVAREASARMRAIDGVEAVAVSEYIPFVRVFALLAIRAPGGPDGQHVNAFTNTVSPGYFDVMGIPLRAGRKFTAEDRAGRVPVVMLNEAAAKRIWPGQNAIGRELSFSSNGERVTATVIGVAADARLMGTDTRIRPEMYIPLEQGSPGRLSFIVKTSRPPEALGRELRRAVWAVVPSLPVESMTDLATLANESVQRDRFFTTALTAFALTAAVLAALGIYAVLAFGVTQRRREIGIRLALGAPRMRVAAVVIGQGIAIGAVGIAAGLLGARWLTQLMESLLLEVSATDASVFLAAAAAAFMLSVIVGAIPALRAVRIDPGEALRV